MRRRLFISFVIFAVIFFSGIVFLLFTESGLRWLLTGADNSMPGSLSFEHISGRLAGPLQMKGLSYRDDTLTVRVDSLNIDWKPLELLSLHFYLADFNASGVMIEKVESGEPTQEDAGLPELSLPFGITVENLLIRDVSIQGKDGTSPLAIKEIMLKADMNKKDVTIDRLSVITSEVMLALEGTISLAPFHTMNLQTQWHITSQQFTEMRGSGELKGDLNSLHLRQILLTPSPAELEADVVDVLKEMTWKATLSLPEMNLQSMNSSWPDITVRNGLLTINGSAHSYDLSLASEIRGRQIPPVTITELKGKGTPEQLTIHNLEAALFDGYLRGQGTIAWKPSLEWEVSLNGQSINPGTYNPEWPGELDMKFRARGSTATGTHNLHIDHSSVQGVLRGYPLHAEAEFTMGDNVYNLPLLELTSGSAHLRAAGSYSGKWDGQWNVNIPALGELIEGGKGKLYGEGTLAGEQPFPELKAQLKGSGLSYGSYRAGNLNLDVHFDPSDRTASHVDLHAEAISILAREIESADLSASGKLSSHSLSFTSRAQKAALRFLADGSLQKKAWEGRLTVGEITTDNYGNWELEQPAPLSISETDAQTGNLCLRHDTASACLKTEWTAQDSLAGHVMLSKVPISLLSTLIPPEAKLDGSLSGTADISYRAGQLHGRLALALPEGTVSYAVNNQESFTLPIEQAGMTVSLDEDSLDLGLDLPFKEQGHIQSSLRLPHFNALNALRKEQMLSGTILVDFNALDIVPLVIPHIEETKGLIRADLAMAGTLGNPEVTGLVSIHDGKASLPDLGVGLSNMRFDVTAKENRTLTVNSQLTSGEGTLQMEGQVLLDEGDRIQAVLSIRGDNVEMVRIPELYLIGSPDIEVRIHDRNIDVQGALSIPEARMEPMDLSSAVPVSKDVYIISPSSPQGPEEEWKITSAIKLIFGDKVAFRGFGLSSRITGSIRISEEPGKATRAEGELELLDGIYKAYGQDLKVQKGRFLFVNLIEDPGLDIKAVREVKDVLAGIEVDGTLKAPHMRVFSVPPMDQSDALSYLLLGRPMNQLSSSEGGQLHNAALSAGLSGGELLAKQIGTAFGLEEVELEKGEHLEESSLTIGKYLSPRLYVSYGIGLFEPINTLRMRYNLSRRWLLQTEYGIESGGDVLYKLER